MPGEFKNLIDEFLEPKVLWGEKLRMYAYDLVRYDSSWTKPNKRFIDEGIYLPSVKKLQGISKLVVAVDDSGSALEYLPQFGGELTSAQLKYCANDVVYLHKIHNELNKILIREKRINLYKDCLQFLKTRVDLDLASFKEDIWAH